MAKNAQIPAEEVIPESLPLEDAIAFLKTHLPSAYPDWNSPILPWPPFSNTTRLDDRVHFLPKTHDIGGPSRHFLKSELAKDFTPEGLLRVLLVHDVPLARLHIPWCDVKGFTPQNVCYRRTCPVTKRGPHRTGIYRWQGEAVSAENAERLAKEDCKDVFVNSNPPPEVWDAVWRIAEGPMSRADHEADLAVAKGFMDAHVWPYESSLSPLSPRYSLY